jgi:serine/threonine protein kinase
VLSNCSKQALDLMQSMLAFNPAKRLTCAELLLHPFFYESEIEDLDES